MDEVKKYWRDKSVQVLGWGAAALATVSGWSVTQSEQFEIGPLAGGTGDLRNLIRAVALLLFASVFCTAWFASLKWIYTQHLTKGVDETVIPWSAAKRYMILVSSLLIVVSILVAFG